MFDVQQKIDQLIWRDAPTGWGAPGRWLLLLLRYVYAVLRDMFVGQLTLRAMSLVYTTLLSIVPLIAFSFSVLKGFGVDALLEDKMYLILEPLGERGEEITARVMEIVSSVNSGLLGGVSLAFFIYTAISMVQKVEEAFNYAWYVTKPRSFARRFTEYVFVLMIGPVIVVVALGMIGSLQNDSVVQWLLANEFIGPVFAATSKLTPYLLVTGVFAFMYWFMPNTNVRITSAVVGGVAGGVLWATLGVIFAAFIVTAARTQAIYGSFAIAITTLIWVYLNWLVLLVGAQLAFYHQNSEYLRLGRREPRLSNSTRERLALNVMLLIGQAFRDPALKMTIPELSEKLKIPSITLAPVAAALEEHGLITLTEKEELVPGRDIAGITLAEILAVVRLYGETGSVSQPSWSEAVTDLGDDLDSAAAETVRGKTLSALLDQQHD